MNYELRTKKGFTLVELLVAIGLLAIVISFAGVIFRVSINAHRTAIANAEIMQKLRAITDQLNADFKGLRKDGEIAIVWKAQKVDPYVADYDDYQDCDNDGHERFDRIMFFADGDFQSYGVNHPIVRGNVVRLCYMLARSETGKRAEQYRDLSLTDTGRRLRDEDRRNRVLARKQHILTADTNPILDEFLYPKLLPSVPDANWFTWNNRLEYDNISLGEWKSIPWVIDPNNPIPSEPSKLNLLSVIMDVDVVQGKLESDGTFNIKGRSNVNTNIRGATIGTQDPRSIHMLLCEGVGEFKIQGWNGVRWVPEVNPDGDDSLSDSDFILTPDGQEVHPVDVPGLLYPYPSWYPFDPDDYVLFNSVQINRMSRAGWMLNQANFNNIPGLGRALKFTFTLYDSKGIIKEGRTFTHIVYLGD
jgi:prepilin-type N-terminal cleavage/methylation domain-containing protein